jgi:hypothetical protein
VQVQTDLQATGSPSAPLDDPRSTGLRSKAADERGRSANLAPRRPGLTIQRATAARSGQSVRLSCASPGLTWIRQSLRRVGLVSDSDDDDPARILVHKRAHCERTLTVHTDRE